MDLNQAPELVQLVAVIDFLGATVVGLELLELGLHSGPFALGLHELHFGHREFLQAALEIRVDLLDPVVLGRFLQDVGQLGIDCHLSSSTWVAADRHDQELNGNDTCLLVVCEAKSRLICFLDGTALLAGLSIG